MQTDKRGGLGFATLMAWCPAALPMAYVMSNLTSAPAPYLVSDPMILVEEITHRVVNEYTQAISAIVMAGAAATNAEAKTVLVDAARRLRAHARAHQALQPPASDGMVDAGDYLERLCGTLSLASLDDRGIRLLLRRDRLMLHADRCWRLGLITAELITNAVRHGLGGGPGKIVIELNSGWEDVVCTITDDGHNHRLIRPIPGRGTHVVEQLAVDLGGRIERRFTPDGGVVRLTFPLTRIGEPRFS
jgi:two-component sensor histidine kinase